MVGTGRDSWRTDTMGVGVALKAVTYFLSPEGFLP